MSALNEEANLPSVILVDGDATILGVLRTLFCTNGFHVHCADSGIAAKELLQRQGCDVIVCDFMLLRQGGIEFLKEVRAIPAISHIPFVILSGLSDSEEVSKDLIHGVDLYVRKPFDPEYLLELVRGQAIRSKEWQLRQMQLQDKFQKRVIHTLSHEFRTPLVAINTGAELLLERGDSLSEDRTKSLLEAIQRGGQRLERLVNDFMLIQQAEAGIAKRLYDSRAQIVVVSELVSEVLEATDNKIFRDRTRLIIELGASEEKARLYRPQFQEVLLRVLENAAKFSGESGDIEVSLEKGEQELLLAVKDRGIGVSSNQVKKAVEIFGQIDRETLEQQGGGLGLALVVRYVDIFGGRFLLNEREGGGTIAKIEIPLA
jgi:signal transduction histidine kinase